MIRLVLLLLLACPFLAHAQFTLTGPRGMVNVPHAEVLEDETFMLGMHTNNEAYELILYGENGPHGSEYVSSLTFGFLERINLSLMLSRKFGDPKQTVGTRSSIGDRSMQLSALILKEDQFKPSLVINLTDPYSTSQYLAGNHVVVTKKLIDSKRQLLKGTLGYGFPFLILFSGQESRTVVKKESKYLTHIFGGVSYQYLPANLQLSLEYDGWNINSGLGITLWDRLSLQAYLQGMKHPGIGLNYVGTIH